MGNSCNSDLCANKDVNPLESLKEEAGGIRGPGLYNSFVSKEENQDELDVEDYENFKGPGLSQAYEGNLDEPDERHLESNSYKEKNLNRNEEEKENNGMGFQFDSATPIEKKIENDSLMNPEINPFNIQNNKQESYNWYGHKETLKQKELELSDTERVLSTHRNRLNNVENNREKNYKIIENGQIPEIQNDKVNLIQEKLGNFNYNVTQDDDEIAQLTNRENVENLHPNLLEFQNSVFVGKFFKMIFRLHRG